MYKKYEHLDLSKHLHLHSHIGFTNRMLFPKTLFPDKGRGPLHLHFTIYTLESALPKQKFSIDRGVHLHLLYQFTMR